MNLRTLETDSWSLILICSIFESVSIIYSKFFSSDSKWESIYRNPTPKRRRVLALGPASPFAAHKCRVPIDRFRMAEKYGRCCHLWSQTRGWECYFWRFRWAWRYHIQNMQEPKSVLSSKKCSSNSWLVRSNTKVENMRKPLNKLSNVSTSTLAAKSEREDSTKSVLNRETTLREKVTKFTKTRDAQQMSCWWPEINIL